MDKVMTNIFMGDLYGSIVASGYPMRTEVGEGFFETQKQDLKRAKALTKRAKSNGAEGQWLTGVTVNFDMTCSLKMWLEAERYTFLNFVSSQSTMHRITKFDISKQYIDYVDYRMISIMEGKVKKYNDFCDYITSIPKEDISLRNKLEEKRKEDYLKILYSNPSGFILTARMVTNYRALLNIYIQRYDHRLPEWRQFCEELLELPLFKELLAQYVGEINTK